MWASPVFKTRSGGCTIDGVAEDLCSFTLHIPCPDTMTIEGKEHPSPFKGRIVDVSVTLPKEYPFKQPECLFAMVPFHPNITKSGQICMDELKWAPASSMIHMAKYIRGLFAAPNMGSPMNPTAMEKAKGDFSTFAATAKGEFKAAEPDDE